MLKGRLQRCLAKQKAGNQECLQNQRGGFKQASTDRKLAFGITSNFPGPLRKSLAISKAIFQAPPTKSKAIFRAPPSTSKAIFRAPLSTSKATLKAGLEYCKQIQGSALRIASVLTCDIASSENRIKRSRKATCDYSIFGYYSELFDIRYSVGQN